MMAPSPMGGISASRLPGAAAPDSGSAAQLPEGGDSGASVVEGAGQVEEQQEQQQDGERSNSTPLLLPKQSGAEDGGEVVRPGTAPIKVGEGQPDRPVSRHESEGAPPTTQGQEEVGGVSSARPSTAGGESVRGELSLPPTAGGQGQWEGGTRPTTAYPVAPPMTPQEEDEMQEELEARRRELAEIYQRDLVQFFEMYMAMAPGGGQTPPSSRESPLPGAAAT